MLELEPEELLRRLATLVPPPGVHGIRYHGVFAPNAKGRARVVPALEQPGRCAQAPDRAAGDAEEGEPDREDPKAPLAPRPSKHERDGTEFPRLTVTPEARSSKYRMPWAELLQKVFAVDVLECPGCSGRLRVLACVTEAVEVRRYLEHAGIDATGPPVARARAGAAPEVDALPEYDLVDPIPED